MTEKESMAWITNMQACLDADEKLPAHIRGHLNEIHRFLIEYCCPNITTQARLRISAALAQQSKFSWRDSDSTSECDATHPPEESVP